MKVKSNKISDVFAYYVELLQQNFSIEESRSNLHLLFDHYFTISKLHFVTDPDQRLSESELLKIHFGVKDLLKHKPIQYITGKCQFLDLDLHVDSSVLIPRPETEELVLMIAKDCNSSSKKLSILDIGTGSGCIPIALAKMLDKAKITAIDISDNALKVAQQNAKLNNVEIEFIQADILDVNAQQSFSKFDVIVSNPPYVRNSEKKMMQQNVLEYEPETALFVEDDEPLLFYEAIASFGLKHLNNFGHIYFEINEAFGDEMLQMMKRLSYSNIKLFKDINGKDRMLRADLVE